MKQYIYLLLLLIGGSLSLLGQECEDIPTAVTNQAVYDLEDKLTSNEELQLEKIIDSYEQQTSIEIAIVLAPTFNDMSAEQYARTIGTCWGVGSADTDNGIVIAISFELGKWFVSTGEGMEVYLTDTRVKQIAETHLVPNLRKDAFLALSEMLEAITDYLGTTPWEIKATVEQEKTAQARFIMLEVFLWIVIFVCLFIAFYFFKRFYRNQQIRKEIKKRLNTFDEDLIAPREKLEERTLPGWAKVKFERYQKRYENYLKNYTARKHELLERLRTNPQDIDTLLYAVESTHQDIVGLTREVSELANEVVYYRKHADSKTQESITVVADLIVKADTHLQDGFLMFEDLKKSLLEKKEQLELLREKLTTSEKDGKYRKTYDMASQIAKEAEHSAVSFLQFVSHYKTINEQTDDLLIHAESLAEKEEDYRDLLARCKKKYPEYLWKECEDTLHDVQSTISAKELLETAYKTVQDKLAGSIVIATDKFNKAKSLLNQTETTYQKIDRLISKQKDAKQAYPHKKQKTEDQIRSAQDACDHDDVDSQAKDYLEKARSLLGSAQETVDEQLIDWVEACNLLQEAENKASEAEEQAEDDKREAKRKRRRSSYSSSSSSAVFSSSGYGSSGGGGFSGGGFSGGSFGGGGAGGSF